MFITKFSCMLYACLCACTYYACMCVCMHLNCCTHFRFWISFQSVLCIWIFIKCLEISPFFADEYGWCFWVVCVCVSVLKLVQSSCLLLFLLASWQTLLSKLMVFCDILFTIIVIIVVVVAIEITVIEIVFIVRLPAFRQSVSQSVLLLIKWNLKILTLVRILVQVKKYELNCLSVQVCSFKSEIIHRYSIGSLQCALLLVLLTKRFHFIDTHAFIGLSNVLKVV